ncbi:MAG: GNAT family N-acetyltransferase [Hyphomicrobiales bacterium]|nr:GNAT family N-acetyltransferase [Hyphomicrobiales bacterium]MCP4997435.1 GNAT family N-acetyltransferase [Hyphomicrobiales bacterium]
MELESQDEDSHHERGGCPVLVTERLVLRTPHPEDTDVLTCLANNARVATMVSRMPHPYTRKDAADFIRRSKTGAIGKCIYAVTNADDGRFLGCCGIEPQDNPATLELGYWIGEPHWGNGYATEAAHAVIDMAFRTRNIDCIDVRCRVTNLGSRRVIHKCGFQFQGTGMVNSMALGSAVPIEWYRLDRKTWISLRSWAAA